MKWITKQAIGKLKVPEAENLLPKLVLFIGFGLALLQLLLSLFQPNPDGTSYLDLASKILEGDFQGAINGYWNPLYPALLALTLLVAGEKSYFELPGVHCLNLALLVILFLCFRRFLRAVISHSVNANKPQGYTSISPGTLWATGYALFFWCTLQLTPILYLTPDLLVMLGIILSSHLLFNASVRPHSWEAITLGLVLGFGYWAKAIMFPFGLALLFSYFLLIMIRSSSWKPFLVSVGVFVLVCSPLIFGISKKVGRPTFSDSGRLAYIWMVNEVTPWFHWQGTEPGSGTPKHPTLQISSDPSVFLFERKGEGTFPPWFDPVYFNAGIQLDFKPLNLVRAVMQNFWNIGINLSFPLFFIAGIIFALYLKVEGNRKNVLTKLIVLIPSIALSLLYSMVHYEARYLAGAFLIASVLMLGLCKIPTAEGSIFNRLLQGATLLCLMTLVIGQIIFLAFAAKDNGFPRHVHWIIAAQLKQNGLQPGAKVGVVGAGFQSYYARLGGWQIIAEAPGIPLSAVELEKALNIMFSKTPVDVVVIVPRQPPIQGLVTIPLSQNYTAVFRNDYLAK